MTKTPLKLHERPKPEKDQDTGRFVPGNNGGPGRPKGSRNKLGEAFFAGLYQEWRAHGPAAIERVRQEDPVAFLKIIASIVPKEIKVKSDPLSDMSDDELDEKLQDLQWLVAHLKSAETNDEDDQGD